MGDFLKPDRIVVGCTTDAAERVMGELYYPIMLRKQALLAMAPESAELTKYVANAMLANRISFMNEVAALCEATGGDIHEIRAGVGSDQRIGPQFLYSGPGYGGSCFPKDVRALIASGREHGVEMRLAETTDAVNERQKGVVARKLRAALAGLRGRRVCVWGVAFKPGTDDTRESASLRLIETLRAEGAQVAAHDPEADLSALPVESYACPYEATRGADALVLMTEWNEYRSLDFGALDLRGDLVMDARNIWDRATVERMGFRYERIG